MNFDFRLSCPICKQSIRQFQILRYREVIFGNFFIILLLKNSQFSLNSFPIVLAFWKSVDLALKRFPAADEDESECIF